MVDLKMRKRDMRGYGGTHHAKLGLTRISCVSQCTIPDMACTTPDQLCTTTETRSSQPTQASPTADLLYPLVSTTLFSSLSPNSLFCVHNSNIIGEHKVKSSLSISPCHDHELTLSTVYTKYSMHLVQHTPSTAYTKYSIHQVQHTPSTVYTEYSIHWVQHTLSTASSQDWLSSLHSHDYELTSQCSNSFWHASLHDRPPSASSPWQLKVNSHCHIATVVS